MAAVLVGAMFRRFGQLNFVGYVITGVLCKYFFSYLGLEWPREWSELASIGGVLLLFLIGLASQEPIWGKWVHLLISKKLNSYVRVEFV